MGMEQTTGAGAQVRTALVAARDALAEIGEGLASLSSTELAELLTLTDDVRSKAAAGQVRIVGEAASRGEFTAARRGAGSGHAWVREHAPSLRQGGSGQLAQFAQEAAAATPSGSWVGGGPIAGAYADRGRTEGVVWARVVSGEIGVDLALVTLREMAKLKDRLMPEAVPTVADAMLDLGSQWGLGDARKVRAGLLAKYGIEGEFDDQQRALRASAFLSSPQVADGDVTEYRMAMTPEQAARLEAAIGPLSKPQPNDATGERDLRPAGQRRVEALDLVIGRAMGVDAADAKTPGGASTVLHVTIPLAVLLAGLAGLTREHSGLSCTGAGAGNESAFGVVGSGDGIAAVNGAGKDSGHPDAEAGDGGAGTGTVLGSRVQGTMLAPSVVRMMACDADVVPVVLGAESEVLDLGRATRLFTRGQRRMLWHRDRGCTFPGCDMPPAWTQAHHLVHWTDGGPSDQSNAALLCQRHHTQVHEQRLIATVGPPDEAGRCVTWDLTPGSYDRDLATRLAEFRRVRDDASAHAHERRRAQRRRLDTGPSEGWGSVMTEEEIIDLADDLAAENADWLYGLPGYDDELFDIPA